MEFMMGIKTEARDYFDNTAGVYDVKHGVTSPGQFHNFARHYEPFLGRAIRPGSHVLEIGCGTGWYTRWLMDRGCTVVGMDISPKMLERARARCPGGTFVVGDCEDPMGVLDESIAAGRFDVILGVNTFCYYPNKAAALARYRQLLRPQGQIVLIEVNGRCPYWRMMTWINKNEIRGWCNEFRRLNAHTIKAMLRGAGLKARTVTQFAFIPNGVSRTTVEALKPVDAILGRLPGLRTLAMRLGVVAEAV